MDCCQIENKPNIIKHLEWADAILIGPGLGREKTTGELVKSVLEFSNKTLIQRQIDIYRELGINDIIIVTGYKSQKISVTRLIETQNDLNNANNILLDLVTQKKYYLMDILILNNDLAKITNGLG